MSKRLSLTVTIAIATLITTLVSFYLEALNLLQPLVVYSVFDAFENIFLVVFTLVFSACLIVANYLKQGKRLVSTATVIFFIIAVYGFMVIGVASLALLWLAPWWMYQFSEQRS